MSKSTSSKPWTSWEFELPKTTELRECKDFSLFQDHEFMKAMKKDIRANVFKAGFPTKSKAAVLLMGGKSSDFDFYDTDTVKCDFRQESFFRYLFGINEPDCFGLLDLEKQESVLFVPVFSEDSERWNGDNRPLKFYVDRYGVNQALNVDDIRKELDNRGIVTLYVLNGVNRDSGCSTSTYPKFDGMDKYRVDDKHLHPLLSELRVFKTAKEIEFMRLSCLVSSQAHVYVMRHIKPGMTEFQCEALFKAWCNYFGAARHQAYVCICASGAHGAILHYGHAARPNDRLLQDGDSIVLDMGAEYSGYCTDLTRSYPVNGKFSREQAVVHNAVREAQSAVLQAMKPGVKWADMHRLAERVIISHLKEAGILHNGSVDEMAKANVGSIFMCHGLGHLLGLDTHDVGGYKSDEEKSKEPGIQWLRTLRELKPGMVITVEPGIYFNDKWIDRCLRDPQRAKFVNTTELAKYRGSGGCRLEDDVLVTEKGVENLTVLPTSIEDIEEVMRAAKTRKS